MGAINGKAFMERMDNLNPEIWLDGRKVTQKLSTHPAFKGILKEKAALYDLQTSLDLKQLMTFPSPDTGEHIGMSYLQPKTKED